MRLSRSAIHRSLSIIAATALVGACARSTVTTTGAPAPSIGANGAAAPVILVSLDGFRRDYLDRDSLPTLHAISREGVTADAMIPSFPTLTFPNHYTLVTGLYPEHHGIVNNTMYDPEFRELFTMSNAAAKESRWWGGEPIWVTAVKQGKRAFSFFWPGSEVEIEGVRPTRFKAYDNKVTFDERVDSVLAWMDLPADQRPAITTLYFDEPDHTGHENGPDAVATAAAAARADSAVGRLVRGLQQRGMYDRVNLVVVADHGMSALSADRTVYLDDVVDVSTVHAVTMSPVLMISANDSNNVALLEKIRRLPHVTAWLKADVPERLHYNEGRRITPIVAVADDGWTIALHGPRRGPLGGNHGYDNKNASMFAIFLAHGPAFRPGTRLAPFPNIDVYPLLAHLLGVTPAKVDGTMDVFGAVLR